MYRVSRTVPPPWDSSDADGIGIKPPNPRIPGEEARTFCFSIARPHGSPRGPRATLHQAAPDSY